MAVTTLSFVPPSLSATYKVLHAFIGGRDGGGLYGGVTLDSSSRIYGVTSGGGARGEGTVFQLSPVGARSWVKTILYDFCPEPHCPDGAIPTETLTLDPYGNLYGPARTLGPSGVGDVFRLSPGPGGWSFSVIEDGATWRLIADKAGRLYTETGPGACNGGYILKLKPPPDGGYWIPKDLYDFCLHSGQWSKGNSPAYGLSWDAAGNLYGVTGAGGTDNHGVVFQLEHTPSGWKEHVLHNFKLDGQDAFFPYGGVVVDSAGSVYGSTLQGGSRGCGGLGCGTIYKVSKQPDGLWQETILYRFPKPDDGALPSGTLAIDSAGSLYGVAGGSSKDCSCGVVFKFSHNPDDTWTYKVLHRFHGTDGVDPVAGVILDAKGNIYGTTTTGGAGGYGVVFKITQ